MQASFDSPVSKCYFCGSDRLKHYKTDFRGIKIVKCQNCSVQFMNPQYTTEHLNDYYASYTDLEQNREKDQGWYEALWEGHNFYIELVEKQTTKGHFLSIGSGDGIELEVARSRGWHTEGFDVDEVTTKALAERLGLTVHSGEFTKTELPKEHYNCIYMHHVLEHPKNPEEYLRKIHTLLKPNGVLFIACPNIASLANRFKDTVEQFNLRKNQGKYYDTYHHLFYYTPSILKKILEKYFNFKVTVVRNGYHVRPHQSEFKRTLMKKYLEVYPYKSTFMLIAEKA